LAFSSWSLLISAACFSTFCFSCCISSSFTCSSLLIRSTLVFNWLKILLFSVLFKSFLLSSWRWSWRWSSNSLFFNLIWSCKAVISFWNCVVSLIFSENCCLISCSCWLFVSRSSCSISFTLSFPSSFFCNILNSSCFLFSSLFLNSRSFFLLSSSVFIWLIVVCFSVISWFFVSKFCFSSICIFFSSSLEPIFCCLSSNSICKSSNVFVRSFSNISLFVSCFCISPIILFLFCRRLSIVSISSCFSWRYICNILISCCFSSNSDWLLWSSFFVFSIFSSRIFK